MAVGACLVVAFGVTVTMRDRASLSAPQATSVPASVIQLAESSVVGVRCINAANETDNMLLSANGTGFLTRQGTVTAAHVIVTCASAGPGSVSAGPYIVSVDRDDPSHDLALLEPVVAGAPLALQDALPALNSPVELLGSPNDSSGPAVEPIAATVNATHATVTLSSEDGASETLTDAIVVLASGAIPGDSGGPAIDAAGQVIGVVEGGGDGRVYLTPAADLASVTG
jgi:serine protease Do